MNGPHSGPGGGGGPGPRSSGAGFHDGRDRHMMNMYGGGGGPPGPPGDHYGPGPDVPSGGGGGGGHGHLRVSSFGDMGPQGGGMPSPRRAHSFSGPRGGGGSGGGGSGGAQASPMPDRPSWGSMQRNGSFGAQGGQQASFNRSPDGKRRSLFSPGQDGPPQSSPRGGGNTPWRGGGGGTSRIPLPAPSPFDDKGRSQGRLKQQQQDGLRSSSPPPSFPSQQPKQREEPTPDNVTSSSNTIALADKKSPATPSNPPLTVSSLAPDKIEKATKAIHMLSKLMGKDKASRDASAVTLPSKQQIWGAMSTIETKIKSRKKESESLQAEISDARKKEALEREKDRERMDLEERRKVAVKRAKKEEAEREKIRKEEERNRKHMEEERRRREAEERAKEMTRRRRMKVEADRKVHVERLKAELQAKKEEEKVSIRSLKRKRHGSDIDKLESSVRSAVSEEQKGAADMVAAKEGADDAKRRVRIAKESADAERRLAEEYARTGGIGIGKEGTPLPIAVEKLCSIMDEPNGGASINTGNLIASIVAANRQTASTAHRDSLVAIPYTPMPPSFISKAGEDRDGDDGDAVMGDSPDDGGDEDEVQRTNEEWSTLARQVTGLADALYTDPTEAPCYHYIEENHAKVGCLVREHVRMKRRKLHNRFVELGSEFVVRKQLYDENQSKGNVQGPNTEEPALVQEEKASAESGRSNSNPYRRARRGERGSGSLGIGIGDVVRTEYEQEQIIAELAAKEAMEKRIRLGGTLRPRQTLEIEKVICFCYHFRLFLPSFEHHIYSPTQLFSISKTDSTNRNYLLFITTRNRRKFLIQ